MRRNQAAPRSTMAGAVQPEVLIRRKEGFFRRIDLPADIGARRSIPPQHSRSSAWRRARSPQSAQASMSVREIGCVGAAPLASPSLRRAVLPAGVRMPRIIQRWKRTRPARDRPPRQPQGRSVQPRSGAPAVSPLRKGRNSSSDAQRRARRAALAAKDRQRLKGRVLLRRESWSMKSPSSLPESRKSPTNQRCAARWNCSAAMPNRAWPTPVACQ